MRLSALGAMLVVVAAVATSGGSAAGDRIPQLPGRIAFSQRFDDDWEIFVMNARGGHARVIRQPGDDNSPTWSRDGRFLAFCGSNRRLYIVDDRGAEPRGVVDDCAHGAAWSSRGSIAYERAGAGIWRINPDGSGHRRVTRAGGDSDPTWSADSRMLAFGRRRSGGSSVWVIDASGDGPRRLIPNACCPRWAPDGQTIAFMRGDAIYLADVDGSNLRRVTPRGGDDLTWSPDSRYLAFSRSGCGAGIWAVAARRSGGRWRVLSGCWDLAGIAWGPSRSH